MQKISASFHKWIWEQQYEINVKSLFSSCQILLLFDNWIEALMKNRPQQLAIHI